jgi:hypothetical protein
MPHQCTPRFLPCPGGSCVPEGKTGQLELERSKGSFKLLASSCGFGLISYLAGMACWVTMRRDGGLRVCCPDGYSISETGSSWLSFVGSRVLKPSVVAASSMRCDVETKTISVPWNISRAAMAAPS